jgi:hypothetical protein
MGSDAGRGVGQKKIINRQKEKLKKAFPSCKNNKGRLCNEQPAFDKNTTED